MDNKFASRKFILTSTIQMLLFLSLWFGSIPVESFQALTITLISAYLASNVVQKATSKEKKDETTL